MITQEERMDREVIRSYAERYRVCPFELGLDASLFADTIIGDYNYVFDPRVNLKRFFSQTAYDTGQYVFLVDEAHNLVDRASSMYSATLYKEDFLAVKKLVKPYSKKLVRGLESCNRELLELKKRCPEHGYQILNDIGVLYLKLLQLHTTMETFLEDYKQIPERKEILEFYFALTTFLNIADLIDDSYVIYDELTSDGRFMVRLYCVHPANNLKLCLDKGVSTVFFSATILPVKYYMEMLSDTDTDQAIYIPSPFDQKKRQIMVGVDVSTKYTKRSIKEYKRVAEYIRHLFKVHPGNYMVFLPSYKMLREVYEQMTAEDCSVMELLCQEQNMKETDREAFLEHFSSQKNVVAFCIMGGIFSEGIDLTGDRLIGSVVVGPGLPQVCNERKIMMDYFNTGKRTDTNADSSVDGFKYAYLYPGINKVFQSAGRVIRTEDDTGVILLLDERFGTGEYNSLFPVEWQDAVFGNFDRLAQKVENFWKREEEP
jgi:DNA excision repair protein ERCC-2